MTITRKYIRQCRTLFPVYGNSERTFLNRLKVQINEHLDLFPDLSYEELVKQFGTPKEVIMEYYANNVLNQKFPQLALQVIGNFLKKSIHIWSIS